MSAYANTRIRAWRGLQGRDWSLRETSTVCQSCFPSLSRRGVLWSPGLCVVLVWFSCSESFPFKHICGSHWKTANVIRFFFFFFFGANTELLSFLWPPVLMNTCAIYSDVSSSVLAKFFCSYSRGNGKQTGFKLYECWWMGVFGTAGPLRLFVSWWSVTLLSGVPSYHKQQLRSAHWEGMRMLPHKIPLVMVPDVSLNASPLTNWGYRDEPVCLHVLRTCKNTFHKNRDGVWGGGLPESFNVRTTKQRQEISGNIHINHNTSAVKYSFKFRARLWWNLVETVVFLQVRKNPSS